MTKIRTIINDALQNINVVEPGEQAQDEDAADALRRLNSMVHGWRLDSLELKLPADADGNRADYTHTDFVLSDDWPLDAAHIDGVTALLSTKLVRRYGTQVDQELRIDAETGWRRLLDDYYTVPTCATEGPLQRMGDVSSQRKITTTTTS